MAGDAEPLRVRFVVSGERISLRSGDAELGSWSLAAVTVQPEGGGAFAFTADAETVTFFPDEPGAFSRLAIISANTSKSKRRRRVKPEPVAATQPERQPRAAERATPPRRRRAPERTRGAAQAAAGVAGRAARGIGRRTWLFALDQARERNLFGLDRVQVTLDMRDDPNHDHTWDHRIANGLAKHVCTVCGRIRINAG